MIYLRQVPQVLEVLQSAYPTTVKKESYVKNITQEDKNTAKAVQISCCWCRSMKLLGKCDCWKLPLLSQSVPRYTCSGKAASKQLVTHRLQDSRFSFLSFLGSDSSLRKTHMQPTTQRSQYRGTHKHTLKIKIKTIDSQNNRQQCFRCMHLDNRYTHVKTPTLVCIKHHYASVKKQNDKIKPVRLLIKT